MNNDSELGIQPPWLFCDISFKTVGTTKALLPKNEYWGNLKSQYFSYSKNQITKQNPKVFLQHCVQTAVVLICPEFRVLTINFCYTEIISESEQVFLYKITFRRKISISWTYENIWSVTHTN